MFLFPLLLSKMHFSHWQPSTRQEGKPPVEAHVQSGAWVHGEQTPGVSRPRRQPPCSRLCLRRQTRGPARSWGSAPPRRVARAARRESIQGGPWLRRPPAPGPLRRDDRAPPGAERSRGGRKVTGQPHGRGRALRAGAGAPRESRPANSREIFPANQGPRPGRPRGDAEAAPPAGDWTREPAGFRVVRHPGGERALTRRLRPPGPAAAALAPRPGRLPAADPAGRGGPRSLGTNVPPLLTFLTCSGCCLMNRDSPEPPGPVPGS